MHGSARGCNSSSGVKCSPLGPSGHIKTRGADIWVSNSAQHGLHSHQSHSTGGLAQLQLPWFLLDFPGQGFACDALSHIGVVWNGAIFPQHLLRQHQAGRNHSSLFHCNHSAWEVLRKPAESSPSPLWRWPLHHPILLSVYSSEWLQQLIWVTSFAFSYLLDFCLISSQQPHKGTNFSCCSCITLLPAQPGFPTRHQNKLRTSRISGLKGRFIPLMAWRPSTCRSHLSSSTPQCHIFAEQWEKKNAKFSPYWDHPWQEKWLMPRVMK